MTNARRSIKDLLFGLQYNRILRLSFPHDDAPPAQFVVNGIDATESLSKDFKFTVELLSDDAGIALKDMQGKLLSIELVRQDGSLRYFTGYVFSFRRRHADGGFTVYEAKLGPWLKFLSLRKNSCLFHGKTLREQTESIFRDYGIHPNWDWRVSRDDPAMTDACQFNETDFNYLSRRWETMGWHYYYEHDATGHKLVVASDSTITSPIDGGTEVRFHGAGGHAEEDAIDRWSPVRHVMPSSVALSSFNFKNPRPVSLQVPTLNRQGKVPQIESYEYAGSYGFKTLTDGDAQSRIRIEEIEAIARHTDAEGNNRSMVPGRWFRLIDHFNHRAYRREGGAGKDDFLILTVRHVATNNYLQKNEQKIQYRNWLTCTRRDVPWRPGRGFNSIVTKILAPQTAIVVGPEGHDGIYTDEYGRVRVQFHWDRVGENDERSSTWLRVASPWAGANLGALMVPRVGSEVMVIWLDGCPDRPIVIGAVFNSWNMSPWMVPEQRALSGLRSRELTPGGGNMPGGRSNHLILDDTNGQIQAQLKSDHQCSQLSLGHISRIEDHQGRQDERGEGWEIATDAWGVARAGKGMLITTESRPNAASQVKDIGETIQRLASAQQRQKDHADVAEKNRAQEQGQQSQVAASIKAQNDAVRGNGASPARRSFPELAEPHLILASAAGIATTTAQSTHIASEEDTAITTGKSVAIAAGDGLFASVVTTLRLLVQKAGMKLVAAAGDIDVQALSNSINLIAKLNITQTGNRIVINAKEDIIINGGGSYVKFSEAGIEHGTKGTFVAHAASHSFVDPKSIALATNEMEQGHFDQTPILRDLDGPLANRKFEITRDDGTIIRGVTDAEGRMPVQKGIAMATAKLRILGK